MGREKRTRGRDCQPQKQPRKAQGQVRSQKSTLGGEVKQKGTAGCPKRERMAEKKVIPKRRSVLGLAPGKKRPSSVTRKLRPLIIVPKSEGGRQTGSEGGEGNKKHDSTKILQADPIQLSRIYYWSESKGPRSSNQERWRKSSFRPDQKIFRSPRSHVLTERCRPEQ